jgi:hypothetical protein
MFSMFAVTLYVNVDVGVMFSMFVSCYMEAWVSHVY